MAGRAVIVHSLDQARAALAAAAACDVPITLLSAEAAAGAVGVLWFRELVATAAAEFPQVHVTAVLDCGDKPGHVLAALRHGLKQIRYTGHKATAEALTAIAADYDAALITGKIEALDLLDNAMPERACRAWLSEG